MPSATMSLSAGVAPQCVAQINRIHRAPQKAFVAPSRVIRSRNVSKMILAQTLDVAAKATANPGAQTEDRFVPVMRPEDLPKGVRKEVRIEGKSVLMFWYRNQIYAIEARSPAEGAYSEGFIRAKFTQDFAIECPSTGSTFSLKDGSILTWYPNNFVLKMLTPESTCRRMEIYPVKLTQDAICVDVSGALSRGTASNVTKGGSDTSLENNNVYGLEPKVYVEGTGADQISDSSGMVAQIASAGVAVLAVGAVGTVAFALIKYISS